MSLSFIMQKYRILGKKGEGTFSEVLKVQNIKEGTYWACKKMKQQYEGLEQVNNLREIQAMRRLSNHPNVLELTEVLFDKRSGTLVLICELMDMNIYELIRGRRHYLADKRIRLYMYQLVKSIDYMHRHGIFHRDVKPENILIKEDLLKLADFGSCRSVVSKPPYTEYISTRWYRAPECLLTDGHYSYKMDIWSTGCVFYEILTLHPLFPGSNEVDQIAKIHDVMGTPNQEVLSKLRNKTRGMNFNFPPKKGSGIEKMLPHCSQDCVDLIYQMCAYDPDERITAKQGLRHPYFKELRETEKKAVALAKAEKERLIKDQLEDDDDKRQTTEDERGRSENKPAVREKEVIRLPEPHGADTRNVLQEPQEPSPVLSNSNAGNVQDKKQDEPKRKKASSSPILGQENNYTVSKYQSSILHPRNHRRVHRERGTKYRGRGRMAASGPNSVSGPVTSFPQVQTVTKPSSYQPSFLSSHRYEQPNVSNSTNTNNTTSTSNLPKLNDQHRKKPAHSNSTFFPSLGQAFVQKQRDPANRNMYGHYQLPSIDRRGAGYN